MTLPKYQAENHGSSRAAKLLIGSELETLTLFWQGALTDIDTNIVVFIPLSQTAPPFNDIVNFPNNPELTLQLHLQTHYNTDLIGELSATILNDQLYLSDYAPTENQKIHVELLKKHIDPMDFNGANSLYFWEMFYYMPAMVCSRLLQENQFDHALTWLKYIWSPTGYQTAQGNKVPYQWNCRPLEESLAWSTSNIDTTDPDAIALHDPLHYKITTFMKMLDLLIARGDAAYRQLERDTLNEAKMWYVNALNLLGDRPYIPINGEWQDVDLATAAEQERVINYHEDLIELSKNRLTENQRIPLMQIMRRHRT